MRDGKPIGAFRAQAAFPPQVEFTGANLAAAELLFPLPRRIPGEGGEAIGYKGSVIFPIRLLPKEAKAPLDVRFSAFFGVCDTICIPAKAESQLQFAMGATPAAQAALLADWLMKVPAPSAAGPVISAHAVMSGGTPALDLALAGPVEDIFVYGADKYYFHAPRIDGRAASVAVSGAKRADVLKGHHLQVISVQHGKGLEQAIAVI